MRKTGIRFMTQAAAIAAIYIVLTIVFAPISFGPVQIRISEILTVLPYFTPAAVPGLFIGCLIGNIFGGAILPDILFGSLATLLGAQMSYLLRKRKYLVPLAPILANTAIVPLVLKFAYGMTDAYYFMLITVAAGEIVSCYGGGLFLMAMLEPHRKAIFPETGRRISSDGRQ